MREAKRRKMGYWEPFNVWWREYVAQNDKRPKVHDMKKWYEANAERVWGGTGPTWDETKKHSKGMRRIEDISDYFRQYRRGRRKKAANGCSLDSDTTDSDAEELLERASTPDSENPTRSQARPTRKVPAGGGGGRGRGRPRQDASAAPVSGTGQEQPTVSGSSAQFPGAAQPQQQPQQQPLESGNGAPPTDAHTAMRPFALSIQLPRDEQKNHLQFQQYQQQQEMPAEEEVEDRLMQLAANGGAPQFPSPPAAQQQRASSSSFLNPMSHLRTASTVTLPPLHLVGSAQMPAVPAAAPPPLQPRVGLAPPLPPQQSQQQQQQADRLLGPTYIRTKREELEQPEQPHYPHPSYLNHPHNYQQQPTASKEEFTEAGSPPEIHPVPAPAPHYPTFFGMPVLGLPFFGGWRSRQQPPQPHHGHHPGHPAPHPPYPGHPPPPYMQRSLTMPRAWSQPPGAAAAAPRRMAPSASSSSWGMAAMTRMLSMPRTVNAPPPQQMPPQMPQHQQHPQQMPQQQQQAPQMQQPPQRSTQTPFAIRAGSAIFGSIVRGGSHPPPPPSSSMSPPMEPYMDPSAPPPDPYMNGSPAGAVPPQLPSSGSPPHPYASASSPPQSQSADSISHSAQQRGTNVAAAVAQPQPQSLLPGGPFMTAQPPQAPHLLDHPHHHQAVPQCQATAQQLQPQQQQQQQQQPAATPIPLTALGQPQHPPPVSVQQHEQQQHEQQQALPRGPPPEPFRVRTRVISLPRSYELPNDPELQRQLHMQPQPQPQGHDQSHGPVGADGGFGASAQETGGAAAGAGAGAGADLATILESGSGEAKARVDGGVPGPDAQAPPEPHGSGSLMGRIFTRGSTMQRLRELFWSWASSETDGAATAGQDAGALPASPLLWGRSNSNTRSAAAGSPRLPGAAPASPDNGPNPFRQQLQRLGSISSSWLLGKRSREETSLASQTSNVTPTSRKLQRGISGVFRPWVDSMMSFGSRRSGSLAGPAAATAAAAAAAAVAEVEAEERAAAGAMAVAAMAPAGGTGGAAAPGDVPAALPELMSCTSDADGERLLLDAIDSHILAALVEDPSVPPHQQQHQQQQQQQQLVAATAMAPAAMAPAAVSSDIQPFAGPMQPQQPQQAQQPPMGPMTAPMTASMAPAFGMPPPPQPPPPSAVLPQPLPQQQPLPTSCGALGCGALPYMPPPPPQHQPPSSTCATVRGPVITTGAPGPSGSRAPPRPQHTQPQPQPQPQAQFQNPQLQQLQADDWLPAQQLQLLQPQSSEICLQQQPPHAYQHQHQSMQGLPVGCNSLQPLPHQQQQEQQQADDGNGGGGTLLLRLSNSLTDYLKQALWGR
ncbi:hypothetical protein PLESTM_000547700 [Pleodorina starrii]|nr:hypothetical protein PLESTM_000547700 [Pleodorina starrii]